MTDFWIGFDLDATLAVYTKWKGATHIGEPVVPVLKILLAMLDNDVDVRIFSARVSHDGTPERMRDAEAARLAIQLFCEKEIGQVLPITNEKDWKMLFCVDDRAVAVEPNTGRVLAGQHLLDQVLPKVGRK